MKIFKNIYEFFHEIKEYQIRNTVFLLITLCLSLFLAILSNVKQKTTIESLESKITQQQNEIQKSFDEYQKFNQSSFPELKETFLDTFSSLEDRLDSSQLNFARNQLDSLGFLSSCSTKFKNLNTDLFLYKLYMGDTYLGDIVPLIYGNTNFEAEIKACEFDGYEFLFVNNKFVLISNNCLSLNGEKQSYCKEFTDLINLPSFEN